MTKFIFLLLLLFSIVNCIPVNYLIAQDKHVPSVIALYPSEIKADAVALSELRIYKNDSAISDDFRKGFVKPGLTPNWKTIREKELAYLEKQDFFSLLVLTITRELTYKEVENRSNLLIYPVKEKSAPTLAAYKNVADQHKMSWVINLTKVEAQSAGDKRILKVSAQLYNVVMPILFVDKTFTADSSTLTENENCQETWQCLLQQIAHPIASELADKIERNIRFSK